MVVKGEGTFPVEETLAPTVVESHVPERTQRRGELRRTSVREEDNGFFFCPFSAQRSRTNQTCISKGGYTVFSPQGGGKRGIGPSSFFLFFVFVLFSPKRGFCLSLWFLPRFSSQT